MKRRRAHNSRARDRQNNSGYNEQWFAEQCGQIAEAEQQPYTHRGVSFALYPFAGTWVYEIDATELGKGTITGGFATYRATAFAMAQRRIDELKS